MIEKVIIELNNRIAELGIFRNRFGLCEIFTKEKISFPAEYCNNELKQVSDFDKNNGTIYHRLVGSVSVSEDDGQAADGCDNYVVRRYPMRLIACVKKDVYKKKNNDAYIDQKIAENIESLITFSNNNVLRSELQADNVSVMVTGINTNRDQVFRDEYKGKDMFIDYEYAYLSINYEITISGDLSCYLKQEC